MAKQTFTTGQVLTAAQMTALQQTAMLGGAAQAKVASYVLVAADAGDAITMSNASPTTITVNTGLFAEGDIVTIINLGAGACTITAGTATVTTSGSLVLATNQGGVLRFTSASAAIFFQFATPASGDIEGVTAGTGISGGGTSGTVTITNSMATTIDAKGDLIVGTGADTFSRLPVGTNTYTLVADSAEATGLKWAAPTGSSLNLTLLSSTSASGNNLTINVASYNCYVIVMKDISGQDAGDMVTLRPNGNATAANYKSQLHHFIKAGGGQTVPAYADVGTESLNGNNAFYYIAKKGNSSSSTNFINAIITIWGGDATGVKIFQYTTTPSNSNNYNAYGANGQGVFGDTNKITSFVFSVNNNFNGGTIDIYGG